MFYDILVSIGTVMILSIVIYLLRFIQSKIDVNKSSTTTKTINRIIGILEDVTYQAVVFTNQTFVENIKYDSENKITWTDEMKEEAFERTKEAIFNIVDQSIINFFNENIGDFDEWIKVKIEALVNSMKVSKTNNVTQQAFTTLLCNNSSTNE